MKSTSESQKGLNKALSFETFVIFCEGTSDSLQRLGRVLHVSSSRNLILRAENVPRIGDRVLDRDLRPVGAVSDIFGPVSSPYVAVKPEVEQPHNLVEHTLYSVASPQLKRRERRR